MADQVQYKFLDIVGVGVLKEEFDKVVVNSEESAKSYADGLANNYDAAGSAATAETNAKDYADGQIAAAFVWSEF